jgi:hypothetical protein
MKTPAAADELSSVLLFLEGIHIRSGQTRAAGNNVKLAALRRTAVLFSRDKSHDRRSSLE